jgi:hypothetical protein
MKPSPRDVDAMGRRLFMAQHARDLAEFEEGFRAWVKTL